MRKIAQCSERCADGPPYDGPGNHEKGFERIVRKQRVKAFVEALMQIFCKGPKLMTVATVDDKPGQLIAGHFHDVIVRRSN